MASIRKIVPAVLVIPTFLAVGVTGLLSFLNSKEAVNDLVAQLSQKVTDNIEKEATVYLDTPFMLHELNLNSIHQGDIDLDNFSKLQKVFWNQFQINNGEKPLVTYLYFANPQGEYIGVGEDKDGSTAVTIRDETTASEMRVYDVDRNGNKTNVLKKIDFDPRSRPWYEAAVKVGKPTWSPIYPSVADSVLFLSAVVPAYDEETGELLGVMAIDRGLSEIDEFLGSLDISPNGKVFIIERSGEIVASSANEPPFVTTEEGQERLEAKNSSDTLIQSTAQYLLNKFDGFDSISESDKIDFKANGQRQIVTLKPLQDKFGLDWLIVVVIPEADFMENINANTRLTFLVCAIALVIASAIGLLASRWILKPIIILSTAAQEIENDTFDPDSLATVSQRNDEIGELGRTFQGMASVLYSREQGLKEKMQQIRNESDKAKKTAVLGQFDEKTELQQLLERAQKARNLINK